MCLCSVHALLPRLTAAVDTTQLSRQDYIELIYMLLCPADASRHHGRWKASLVDKHGVSYHREIDERDLVDVEVEIAVKDALSVGMSILCPAPATMITKPILTDFFS
jgi:hypothetical protein